MKHDLKQMIDNHIRRVGRRPVRVGGVVAERHVAKQGVDVGEVVVVGEEVVGVRVDEEASSRAVALPKNLIALLPYRTRRGGVSEAYCPVLRCTPQGGMGKTRAAAQCSGTKWQTHRLWC